MLQNKGLLVTPTSVLKMKGLSLFCPHETHEKGIARASKQDVEASKTHAKTGHPQGAQANPGPPKSPQNATNKGV